MQNSKRNILIISPHYSPMNDGLAHYTELFSAELKKFANVAVLTNSGNKSSPGVFPYVSSWSFGHLRKVFLEKKLDNFNEILVQYVPFMYNRKGGINFSFCFFILALRVIYSKRVTLMVHEINYPFEWKIKSVIMFFSHSIMMSILLLASHQTFTATKYFNHQLKTYFFAKNINILPVGSNIVEERINKKTTSTLTLGMFGKLHPAKEVPFVIKTLIEIWREQKNFRLIYIGESSEKILSLVDQSDAKDLQHFLEAFPESPSAEVSEQLAQLDIFVAYFVDGLSARRGSVMAALEHGIEVISTKGAFTDDLFENRRYISLFHIDKEMFKKELTQKIAHYKPQSKNEIKEFYRENFSWQKIAKNYFDLTNPS